mgnify:CR=1 FL=1
MLTKCQLISKGLFGFDQKTNEIFLRISALNRTQITKDVYKIVLNSS